MFVKLMHRVGAICATDPPVCSEVLPEDVGCVVEMARTDRPRRSTGVTQDAIETIRELIVSGEWGARTRLPREADLAAQLGLSRNSLREAVRALALARVLEVRQGDGTYVSSLEPGELLAPTRFATRLLQGRTVRARLWHGIADRGALDLARAEHTRIYEAICARDADLARAATLVHIANNETWLREHLGPADDIPLADET